MISVPMFISPHFSPEAGRIGSRNLARNGRQGGPRGVSIFQGSKFRSEMPGLVLYRLPPTRRGESANGIRDDLQWIYPESKR